MNQIGSKQDRCFAAAPSLVARLIVGLAAGFVIGVLSGGVAMSLYPDRVPFQPPADHEARQSALGISVLVITEIVMVCLALFAGHWQFSYRVKAATVGAAIGIAVVVLAAHAIAYAGNEWPLRGKGSQTSVTLARSFGVAAGGIVGGTLGYGFALRRSRDRH